MIVSLPPSPYPSSNIPPAPLVPSLIKPIFREDRHELRSEEGPPHNVHESACVSDCATPLQSSFDVVEVGLPLPFETDPVRHDDRLQS
jgi:hypothetical protein